MKPQARGLFMSDEDRMALSLCSVLGYADWSGARHPLDGPLGSSRGPWMSSAFCEDRVVALGVCTVAPAVDQSVDKSVARTTNHRNRNISLSSVRSGVGER